MPVLGNNIISGVTSIDNGVGVVALNINSNNVVTRPTIKFILGSPTNTSGSGNATSFSTYSYRGLSFVTDRITVSDAGNYVITLNTISNSNTGRVDCTILINGANVASGLTEDNEQGYRQRSVVCVVKLSANDYIQFYNQDWYNAGTVAYDVWRTASVAFIG